MGMALGWNNKKQYIPTASSCALFKRWLDSSVSSGSSGGGSSTFFTTITTKCTLEVGLCKIGRFICAHMLHVDRRPCRQKTGVVIHSRWGQQSHWTATLIESLYISWESWEYKKNVSGLKIATLQVWKTFTTNNKERCKIAIPIFPSDVSIE